MSKLIFLDSKKINSREIRLLGNMHRFKFGIAASNDVEKTRNEEDENSNKSNSVITFFKNLFRAPETKRNYNPLPEIESREPEDHIGFYTKLR